ncbi:LuxR C-terminal-related transcriptional regulator [Lysinibacillus cavernae]|uniref:LuxR C-terminal-related transcriptional regulator n=1 Tax=Lysinibacillus cavernae TaxID=2666135 RepID=UPI0018C2F7A4|nr:LuxR C-terminal-related transcriptional regulator [Lysinibacillus cavernae]
MYNKLSVTDYEKIIYFASQITKAIPKVRSSALQELSSIFGYNHTLFWLADNEGQLKDPINYNISDRMLDEYLNGNYNLDFLYPPFKKDLFKQKNVLRLSDVTTHEQYELSEYYKGFMNKYGFYDEMVVTLSHNEQVIGTIGMIKREKNNYFTNQDVLRFEYLSTIISSALLNCSEEKKSILSRREQEVVNLVKKGYTNAQIGTELFISIHTVKKHLQNIFDKYGVLNRTELISKLNSNKNRN